MTLILSIFIFLLGMAFGSFFNVCIYRIPARLSLLPKSHCPNCDALIKPQQNIPIFSYIFLKGKCRNCGSKIHWHYFIVELITPILFLLLFLKFGFSLLLLKYLIFISAGIIIFFIDAFHRIIPDIISLPLIAIGLAFSVFPGSDQSLLTSLLSALFGFLIFLVTGYVFDLITKRESLGGGDIKLIAAIGAFLGIFGLIFTIFVASFSALILLIIIKHDRSNVFPFGPFLIFGATSYIFAGNIIFQTYLNLFF
ncbi:MAG: prepilin peptidase [Candidatus Cloacimonetes bacterium]|nr:prepilin peptidase [Candidatus Cloacimonadota bacterium]MCF7814162.1 prepilin peptidase [Candidatus Cloacimonadota bacterium]MCF7868739.1 prepilin peptidase [Candidatus Cloacimonadota bacterium]MCF7884161.1 prepilin peptidase [Candidatus Cloacimonadota bacterium]